MQVSCRYLLAQRHTHPAEGHTDSVKLECLTGMAGGSSVLYTLPSNTPINVYPLKRDKVRVTLYSPAKRLSMPKSTKRSRIRSSMPRPGESGAPERTGTLVVGSIISASSIALSRPCSASVALEGGAGWVGSGKDSNAGKFVGEVGRDECGDNTEGESATI